MKIRTKVISVLALLFAALIVLDIAVQTFVVMPSFAEPERDDAKIAMKRIEFVLGSSLDSLASEAADWANWSDADRLGKADLSAVAMKQLQVDALLIFDTEGRLISAGSRDLDTGEPADLGLASAAQLPVDFPWRRHLASGIPPRGLLRTNRGIMMLAAAPVQDGVGTNRGTVIMGRLLTTRQLRRMGDQAQAAFAMTPSRGQIGSDRLVESETVTMVYRPYADIYGRPLMSFEVKVPRRITARGGRSVAYAATCLIFTSIAALLLLVCVLNRVVLAPLARVTRHAVRIGDGSDLTARLDLPGRDEIAVLAREFDRMVDRVADSRRQLVDESFRAGFAELSKGVLHNLGNAMTPLCVRLASLGERLRDAPAVDVEIATAELATESAGSERHADLLQFLRLGSREMRAALADAQTDVMVIQRQTLIVQSALTELMRSTRNEHVIESVRLPDLVLQTLEIVPDAARQRLTIEADESLQRVGVVQVARTILRLVLQNLIINAADAVRDSGRDKGVFKVTAEILRDQDREQLHLNCADDGVGISQANLERVFDQGFSTKSRDTNYGIGLHWCANAIAALGGRIWAASDGPNRGTCMHVLLPLAFYAIPST